MSITVLPSARRFTSAPIHHRIRTTEKDDQKNARYLGTGTWNGAPTTLGAVPKLSPAAARPAIGGYWKAARFGSWQQGDETGKGGVWPER